MAGVAGIPRKPIRFKARSGSTAAIPAMYRQKLASAEWLCESWMVIGRRGGKSFVLSLIAVYLACFRDWRLHLVPGERATVMVIAADRKQARVIMRYFKGLVKSTPILASMLESERLESLDLNNSVTIEIHTASFRTTRGYTLVAALCDELAFWPTDESASEPDVEILNALRPGMATIPDAMLLCTSSPYARRGALWEAYRKYFGTDNPALVWQADTRTMNPSTPQRVIDAEIERDPASAAAEYGARFRSDIEAFVNLEVVNACVSAGVYERPPRPGQRYFGFVDPSGGSGTDSFTLAVSHRDGDSLFLDSIREAKPPLSPEGIVSEFSDLLKSYGIRKIFGDRYAGMWPVEQFRKHGITYEQSAKPKSDLYRDLLPLINSKRVDLLDHQRLISQLVGLERRTARSGKDSIDHFPGGHDDIANACAGALTAIAVTQQRLRMFTLGPGNAGGVELDPRTGRPLIHRNALGSNG